MFRSQIRKAIEDTLPEKVDFSVERPENSEHGDYSSNVALVLAKKLNKNPKEVAEELKSKLKLDFVEKIEIAGPGFLNFYIAPSALTAELQSIFIKRENDLNKISRRGRATSHLKSLPLASGAKEILGKTFSLKNINIEFVSANPTGPLTMGNGRSGFYGDALANILEFVGHKVTREYYINDAGNQIKLLGESILAAEGNPPAGGPDKDEYYKGEYIKKLKGKTAKQAAAILLKEIKTSLKKAGIKFDIWFSEDKNLHKKGELKKVLEFLDKKGEVRESEGALWLDDNVLVKSNKETTYFLADLAYHYDKFIKRKFDIAIDIWGADHHGYVERMKRGMVMIGINPERLKILILQLVRLMSKGKEMRMSKRTGNFVTLDELLDEVGIDAARWFFLEKSLDTHMNFDMDLAKERSKKNPVYYVQYAHARACSILRKSNLPPRSPSLKVREGDGGRVMNFLDKPEELDMIKKIFKLDEVIEDIATDYQVHRLTRYAYELAQTFTGFYEKHKVIDPKNLELTSARLFLVSKTQGTLKKTLSLLGIAAPEKM